jgi:hypothetical protein
VSGSEGSSIVFMTSTNGTFASTAPHRSGRMFVTAPTSSPPALIPWMATRSRAAQPRWIRCSADAMKSVKVLRFDIILP